MAPTDPLAALRATVAYVFAPNAETRLVTIDAADLITAGDAAVDIALVTSPASFPGAARVDPLRLPLVEGVADAVVAREPLGNNIGPRLREYWRVLAPAGVLVLILPLPARWWPWRDFSLAYRRGTIVGAIVGAMFQFEGSEVAPGALVARAVKADGLAPAQRRAVAVNRPARA